MDTLYRRNGKKVYIKQPEYSEMKYVKELWADVETMKELGGVFDFNEKKWESFYKKMISPTDGKNFYCIVYNNRDKEVGEVSFHGYDSSTSTARFNMKIQAKYRGKGYGEEACKLLLEYYFLEFGGKIIMDHIETKAGLKLAKKIGFEEVRRNLNNTTVRMESGKFLNFEKKDITNVEIVTNSKMKVSDYALIYNILKEANKVADRELFNIKMVSFRKAKIKDCGLEIEVDIVNEGHEDPNILILPNGDYIQDEEYTEILDYILSCYRECDYICAIDEGINYLIRCNELKGIALPDGEWKDKLKDDEFNDIRIVNNKTYIDNGKIMISTSLMGNIKLCLDIVKKVGGRNLERKVGEFLGLK